MVQPMRIGSRSILYGCHQAFIHPLFVLYAWVKLYGLPTWRELVAIIIHDWGYWGSPNMDGPEGELHPIWAAKWCSRRGWRSEALECLKHSRFMCKNLDKLEGGTLSEVLCGDFKFDSEPSRLCWADKMGTAAYPTWLWVLLCSLTGELKEYMDQRKYEIHLGINAPTDTPWQFFRRYKEIAREWIAKEAVKKM